MKSARWCRRVVPVAMLAVLSAITFAHADDDEPTHEASLYISLDNRGGAQVDLTLADKPASWDPIKLALSQSLHCPVDRFSQPRSETPGRYVSRLPEKQRQAYLQAIEEANQKRLQGHCDGVLVRYKTLVSGSLELGALTGALHDAGVPTLDVTLRHPETSFSEHSREDLQLPYAKNTHYLSYQFDNSTNPPPVRVAYGFRRADLERLAAVMFGFMFVPVMIVLWMRRAALKHGVDDPVGASFSYFKTLNWVVNGAILVWLTSGFSRGTLNDLLRFTLAPGWKTVMASILAWYLPAWVTYFACIAVSYTVYVRLRNASWTRGEFLLQQSLGLGALALPLMFALGGIQMLRQNLQAGVVLFLLAYTSRVLCVAWKVKISNLRPEAVTSGELRDRIFELAKKAGVQVRQIFILPAGKGNVANAFAAKNNVVIFTDYLLQRLNKREVDAVASHELTHLRLRHPAKLGMAFLFAIFIFPAMLPTALTMLVGLVTTLLPAASIGRDPLFYSRMYAALTRMQAWPHRDLVLLPLGLAGFYFLSRRFEHQADAGAVALSGDPEAKITALLKLSRVNLVPIQWSRTAGSWLTHPSTLHRVQRIAAENGVTPERLQQILDQFTSESGSGTVTPATNSADHYPIPLAPDRQPVTATGMALRLARSNMWVLTLAHVLPAIAAVWVVQMRALPGATRLLLYIAGFLLSIACTQFVGKWMAVRSRESIKKRLLEKFEGEGIPVARLDCAVVGFAPGPNPRFYVGGYNWDFGLLVFGKDQLCYVGEQARLTLSSAQVVDVWLGQGQPSWSHIPRIYVRWRDEANGRDGIFSLTSGEPCSTFGVDKQVHEFHQRLQAWVENPGTPEPLPEPLNSWEAPKFSEITRRSPPELGSLRGNLKNLLVFMLPIAVGLCILLRLGHYAYVCSVVAATRVFLLIPYWRYRDLYKPVAATASAVPVKARGASAS